jgi:hypothetical protein
MLTLQKLKGNLLERAGLLDSFSYREASVAIGKEFKIYVNEELIDVEVKSLEEARSYAKTVIDTRIILQDVNTLIPEEKVANIVRKYHDIDKITDTLVESYLELASSNIFSVDPVITEMKQNSSSLTGKLEYRLNDGSVVAINEDTQHLLNDILSDKYQIVEYMRESKDNFMHVLKELGE